VTAFGAERHNPSRADSTRRSQLARRCWHSPPLACSWPAVLLAFFDSIPGEVRHA
jgi:hypothetical protein